MLEVPVVIIAFNRADLTSQVLAAIKTVRPTRLYVIADGPRVGVEADAAGCAEVRALFENVGWQCSVKKNYSDVNLGCGVRVASGLDWVFEQEPAAIILEDDCLPDPSFFAYCEQLLDRYKDEPKVLSVSGTNYLGRWRRPESYFFSAHFSPWGWATWARAWKHFDFGISQWQSPAVRGQIEAFLGNQVEFQQRSELFDRITPQTKDIWDFQWKFAHLACQALTIVPTVNLVTNIGFGPRATHCTQLRPCMVLRRFSVEQPLVHPKAVVRDERYDLIRIKRTWPRPTYWQKLRRVARMLKRRLCGQPPV